MCTLITKAGYERWRLGNSFMQSSIVNHFSGSWFSYHVYHALKDLKAMSSSHLFLMQI